MLTISSGPGSKDCSGRLRRDFLRVGTLSLGSLSLSGLLAARATAARGEQQFVRDNSVVLLYLSGGASHIETFDPKMTAPPGTRSVTGEVKSSIAGVTFGGTFPQLAQRADRMAVVRSFSHKVGSHEQAHVHVLSGGTDPGGKQEAGFSMGSAYARLAGTNHPATGIPTNTLLVEREIDRQYRSENSRVTKGSWPGSLGPLYGPFRHEIGWQGESEKPSDRRAAADSSAQRMTLNISAESLDDRLQLLRQIDRLNRNLDTSGRMSAVDKFQGQAVNLLLRGAAQAFELEHEDTRLIQRYDTSHIQIGHKSFRPSTLGKQMLVARRLCEAGCGFVTVHSAGWDMHADGNNPGITVGMEMLGRSVDQAVSAFLDDVKDRGLSEKILLIITGDFGRTPKVNKRGGRDHWARLGTLAFAGGGLNMGQVIGDSAPGADVPADNPISTPELMASVMHTLFDVGQLRLERGIPTSLVRTIESGKPIEALF